MNATTTTHPVASGPDHTQRDNSRLWYSDPTGRAAVQNIMDGARADDYAVVDTRGNVLFRIKPDTLKSILPLLAFTFTRRGRGNLRAHRRTTKYVPGLAATSSEDATFN